MAIKTDFLPAFIGQHAINRSRRVVAGKFILDAGLAILTFFAVFSGLIGSQENLEKMGVSLGPDHV